MPASRRLVLVLVLVLATPSLAGCATDDAGSDPAGEDATMPDEQDGGGEGQDPAPPGEDSDDGSGEGPAVEGPPPEVGLERVVTGLERPTLVTHPGDGSGRLFVLEQPGRVRVVEGGQLDPEPYLDLTDRIASGGERGLLGLAVAPDFPTSGELYVSYTDTAGDSVLERFTAHEPRTDRPDPDAGTVLLTQAQPYSNHNGGHVTFGPDGDLYLGLGDGGAGGDPDGNAQDTSTWLGSMLRLDVSGAEATAPEDNPFVGQQGRDEIWVYGLRNPWRFSFDTATGDLWIGDVGQSQIEEVNHEPAGSAGGNNYGWNVFEGYLPYAPGVPDSVPTFPVMAYQNDVASCAVTGGYVYHGDAIPDLEDSYIFGDLCSGTVYAGLGVGPARVMTELAQTDAVISSFGQDADGELYLVDYTGSVSKIVPA